jgi:phage terminase small subunit
VENFELEEHHVKVLTAAAEAWDRAQEARGAIAKHGGAFFTDRFGAPKVHPAVAVERDAKILFARLLRELRLDIDPPDSRPPGLGER